MSPQRDCGYDINDYRLIDPLFGSMDDMDALIARAHEPDLLMMDPLFNHTSDQHHWFQQAKLSKTNPYRDYYVWRDAKPDGSLPTNWLSMAGGSMGVRRANQLNTTCIHFYHQDQPDPQLIIQSFAKKLKDYAVRALIKA